MTTTLAECDFCGTVTTEDTVTMLKFPGYEGPEWIPLCEDCTDE